jgi:5,10-methylenetetrahydrofolate reductase
MRGLPRGISVTTGAHTHDIPVSFEVYPPRDLAAAGTLVTTIKELATVDPQFISVTFGAGGSERKGSLDVLKHIKAHTNVEALAHITCVGNSHAEAGAIVREFLEPESRRSSHFVAILRPMKHTLAITSVTSNLPRNSFS